MKINPNQFIGKEINEIQMYESMCVINFTDGSCLEITPEVGHFGTSKSLDYDYTEIGG